MATPDDPQSTRCLLTCPHCGSATYTRLRRWYMGHDAAWWCDWCVTIIPPVALVRTPRP
jgi:hypothetical protein